MNISLSWNKIISKWLINTGKVYWSIDGKKIEIWELKWEKDDEILSCWATHFRNQYCLDEDIDILRDGTGYSRKDYLLQFKFPDKKNYPGPIIRAGDFSEILIADLLEYIFGLWVPRTRYSDKSKRDISPQGPDTIGFYFYKEGKVSQKDTLTIIESKADYSGRKPSEKLQDAINHSAKDVLRKAEALNAIKQRFLVKNDKNNANKISRFQNEADNPYIQKYGAAAHLDNNVYCISTIKTATCVNHPAKNILLIVIKGNEMMSLVHELYRRAADEA